MNIGGINNIVNISDASWQLIIVGVVFILLIFGLLSFAVLRFFQLRKRDGFLSVGGAVVSFVVLLIVLNIWFV